MNKQLKYAAIAAAIAAAGCSKDDKQNAQEPVSAKQYVAVTNEGSFGANSASLTIYDLETKTATNNVFFGANGIPLGDVANHVAEIAGHLYVTVNNSAKIYVIDKKNFKYVSAIEGFQSPRMLLPVSESKAYVSDLQAKGLHIIDLKSNIITGFISTDNGNKNIQQHNLEDMLLAGGKLYASSWSMADQIMVIDTGSDKLIDSIKVGKQPNSMAIDAAGALWVLSDGGAWEANPIGYEAPSLSKIDLATGTVTVTVNLEQGKGASNLSINTTKDTVFFINGTVKKMATNSQQPESITPSGKLWYSMASSKFAAEFYCADAIDYKQSGIVYRYSNSGDLLDSFTAGVNPGSFCFVSYDMQ
jgi:YVTN family beta-propeller protein